MFIDNCLYLLCFQQTVLPVPENIAACISIGAEFLQANTEWHSGNQNMQSFIMPDFPFNFKIKQHSIP